jgi:hypothetical protein
MAWCLSIYRYSCNSFQRKFFQLLFDNSIDLQANEIRTYGSETLSPLPDSIFSKLQKDLKKLVDDTKVPIKSDQTVQDVKLKKYFLAFFIRLFKNYHKFLVRHLIYCLFSLS